MTGTAEARADAGTPKRADAGTTPLKQNKTWVRNESAHECGWANECPTPTQAVGWRREIPPSERWITAHLNVATAASVEAHLVTHASR